MRPVVALASFVLASSVALPIFAAPTEAEISADELFQRARSLTAENRFAEACPLFAESHRLDPGVGVLLYLGDCYEKNGQLLAAWTTFQDAAPRARELGQVEREQTSRNRAAALFAKLPKLVLSVPAKSRVPGLEVERDGVVVPGATWGESIPVEAGSHTVRAHAPAFKSWGVDVSTSDGSTTVVNVPELLPVTAAPPPPSLPPAPAPEQAEPFRWSLQHTFGVIAGGVGLVAVGVGTGFGVAAIDEWDAAMGHCSGQQAPLECDLEGVTLADSATTKSSVSTASFIVGGVGLGAAILLFATASWGSAAAPRSAVLPLAVPGGAGLAWSGAF